MSGPISMPTLSVIVPAFNEEKTISAILSKLDHVLAQMQDIPYEIIVVDDGSTDGTFEKARATHLKNVQVMRTERNLGKGRAVQHGIRHSSFNYLLVQDADLEYDPSDIPSMLNKLKTSGPLTVVYGSRVAGAKLNLKGLRAKLGIWPGQGIPQRFANQLLTVLFKIRHQSSCTDLLTGYKLYPRELFLEWSPETHGFETDHEITVRIIGLGYKIVETPVSYAPRSREEGKKIRSSDFLKACRVLLKRAA